MKNPYVNIIGHPDDGRYDIDYEALVQGAKEYGKVLELNNHSMDPDCTRSVPPSMLCSVLPSSASQSPS